MSNKALEVEGAAAVVNKEFEKEWWKDGHLSLSERVRGKQECIKGTVHRLRARRKFAFLTHCIQPFY
jgi:hypothetical protein